MWKVRWWGLLLNLVRFSCSVVSNSLRPHESQHARPPCPSPTCRVHSDSRPSSQWCHPAISSSVVSFSSCPQSLPASESFPMSHLFTWGGQSTGVSALASFLLKWWDQMPWSSFSECWALSQLFHSPLSLSSRGFLIHLHLSAYQRLLLFLPAILIPACASPSPAFLMMYSAYKLNKQGDNIQLWRTPFPIWNQSVVPCPLLTVASWPAYRFLKVRGGSREELPHIRGQGRRPGGATPRPRSSGCAGTGGLEELFRVQGQEGRQWGDTPRPR